MFKLIAILLGTLFSLLLVEVGYRVYHYCSYNDLKTIGAGQRKPVVQPNDELDLGRIIQLSAFRYIIYELIPSSRYLFQGVLVETNAQGFRDKNYPAVKSKKTFQIIGLGDSVMFGWGVNEGDCFLTKLENKLNEQDSITYEIVNTAVPGYNTVMEVATLAHKIDLEKVDMVIINYIGNDCHLPNFIRKKPDYFSLRQSLVFQRLEDNDGIDGNLQSAPFNKQGTDYAHTLDRVPPEYHDMVDIDAYMNAMKRLKQLQDEYGFKVITLATNPDAEAMDYVQIACKENGFELMDVFPVWQSHKAAYPDDKWGLSKKDGHPSAPSHAMIAGVLERGILEWLRTVEIGL